MHICSKQRRTSLRALLWRARSLACSASWFCNPNRTETSGNQQRNEVIELLFMLSSHSSFVTHAVSEESVDSKLAELVKGSIALQLLNHFFLAHEHGNVPAEHPLKPSSPPPAAERSSACTRTRRRDDIFLTEPCAVRCPPA